jgi:hypothetical protein
MASNSIINVADQQALDSAVTTYISKGFIVANRTTNSVVMYKKKEFSILMAVVGLLFMVLPCLIYIIYYMCQSDKMVELRING